MEPFTRTNRRNWSRKKISAALKARGLTQTDIWRQLGKSPAMVSEVVVGRRKSFPIALAIAEALGGLHPHDIWPRLYAAPDPPSEPTPDYNQTDISEAS